MNHMVQTLQILIIQIRQTVRPAKADLSDLLASHQWATYLVPGNRSEVQDNR